MHVVILGAGTVGTSIAAWLCGEHFNVCLIDDSRDALSLVEEKLDVQTVRGSACDAIKLFQAGVQSAELCLAVTSKDEVNLVGASLARAMGARRSVARIFNPSYRDFSTFDYQRHFQIDRLLSLEHLTALELAKAIRAPGLFAVENFARGGVQVQEVAVEPRSSAAGAVLKDLHMPADVRIGLISNDEGTSIPLATDVINPGDHVTLIGAQEAIDDVKRRFERKARERLNVIIVGGGEIGFHLATALQKDQYRVLLLEADAERCEYIAAKLPAATIVNADATRRAVLEESRVGSADVFVAATGRDEDNIVCGVEARELGAGRILSIIRHPDYANVLHRLGIDVAVSPREVMAREVIGMVMGGPVLSRSVISEGDASVLEVEVQPDAPITKSPLKEIRLQHCLIAALVREDFARVARGDDQLQAGDTAVVLIQGDNEQIIDLFRSPK